MLISPLKLFHALLGHREVICCIIDLVQSSFVPFLGGEKSTHDRLYAFRNNYLTEHYNLQYISSLIGRKKILPSKVILFLTVLWDKNHCPFCNGSLDLTRFQNRKLLNQQGQQLNQYNLSFSNYLLMSRLLRI